MINGPLLSYTIAKQHLPGLANESLKLFGAVLKDTTTGQIVAHVQPTQVLQSAVGMASNLTPAGAISSVVTGGVTIAQNDVMRRKLNAIQSTLGNLQLTQFATLGVSLVGVGVTVASTALILSRIKRVEAKVIEVGQKIDAVQKFMEDEPIRAVLVDFRTSLQRLDELDDWADARDMVKTVENDLHHQFNRLAAFIQKTVERDEIDPEFLSVLLSAFALCNEAQLKALFTMNEAAVAKKRAQSAYDMIEHLSVDLPPDELALKLTNADTAQPIADNLHAIRTGWATRPLLVETLIERDIPTVDYIRQAEQDDTDEPLLFLPA